MKLFAVRHRGWSTFVAFVRAEDADDALREAQEKCNVMLYPDDVTPIPDDAVGLLWSMSESGPD